MQRYFRILDPPKLSKSASPALLSISEHPAHFDVRANLRLKCYNTALVPATNQHSSADRKESTKQSSKKKKRKAQ